MTSLNPDRFDNLDRPLRQAARSHRLRNAGRGVVAFGSTLIIGQALLIVAISAYRPEAITYLSGFTLIGLFTLLVASIGVIVMAGLRDRRERLVAEAEQQLPSLGRRLSTSMELRDHKPHHEAVPDTLRSAVYTDTGDRLRDSTWGRFVDRRSALTWVFTGVVVILLQCFFFLQSYSNSFNIAAPGLGNVSMQPSSFTPPPAEDAAEEKPAEENPRVNATITITEPAEDGWATRIEAVLVEFNTESEFGLTDLAVVVNHNGKTYRTAAFDTELSPGKQTGEAEFYLDEMPLEDYDVLAFHIEGRHKTTAALDNPGEKAGSVTVASGLKFLQIRPFNEDILFRPMAMGEGDPCLKILAWMIEEQRRLVRGGWLLQPSSGLPTNSERYALVGERVAEDQEQLRGVMREARVLFVESPNTTPLMLTLLDQAGDAMDRANVDLSDAKYPDALQHQQQSLSHLVEVLREFEKVYGRFLDGLETPEGPDGPKPPSGKKLDLPDGKTLSDRQLMRDDITAFDYELEEIAEQQAQLNWEQMQEEQTSPRHWRQHDLPQNQNDTGTPPADQETKEEEEDKKADSEKNKPGEGKKPAQNPSPSAASGSGQGSQGQSGQSAQSQAQAQKQQPSEQTPKAEASSPSKTSERQEALAERLDELAKNAVTGESVRQALREAAEAMREQATQDAAQTANRESQTPGRQEAGRRAADLIDRALDERDRELHDAQLRQIENAMRQIADQQAANPNATGGDAGLDPTEREALADKIDGLAQAIDARRHGNNAAGPTPDGNLAERRTAAAGALREAADTLRQMSAAGPDAEHEQLDRTLDRMAEAQRELEGSTKQLESLERRLAQLKDQLEGQARRSKPAAGPVQEAWEKDLAAQGELLSAQLRAADLGESLPPKRGETSDLAPTDPPQKIGEQQIHSESTQAKRESSPGEAKAAEKNTTFGKGGATAASVDVYHDWTPDLDAVIGALSEVRQALSQTRALDPLATQRTGQSPAEYRRLVNLYFESLSRNAVRNAEAKN
ncbi:MAG: hypothetical protein AAGH99_12680 [Planctomycetota bacterium]